MFCAGSFFSPRKLSDQILLNKNKIVFNVATLGSIWGGEDSMISKSSLCTYFMTVWGILQFKIDLHTGCHGLLVKNIHVRPLAEQTNT